MSDPVEVKRDSDGKIVVATKVDSHADAMALQQELSSRRRRELTGLSRFLAFDQDISPKFRETMVAVVRLLGIAFALVLGAVVAITSGHAAIYIFPDAPMPDWLLFTLGAMTVVGGIWAADEFIKIKRDDIDDNEQRFRLMTYGAIVFLCIAFDIVGVATTRIASASGSLVEMKDNQEKASFIRTQIKIRQNEMVMLEPPAIPSTAYEYRIASAMSEPTRTGRPVQTVGELMQICDNVVRDYCLEYQNAFARIKFLQGERVAALNTEQRGPQIEDEIRALQVEIAGLELTSANVVDEFFSSGETPEEIERDAKRTRLWRIVLISIGQVLLLSVVVLLLLDDRHDRIAARRAAALARQTGG